MDGWMDGLQNYCTVATSRARNRRIDHDDDDDECDECDGDIRRVASEICARSFDVQIRGHGRGVCFNKQNDDDDEASLDVLVLVRATIGDDAARERARWVSR